MRSIIIGFFCSISVLAAGCASGPVVVALPQKAAMASSEADAEGKRFTPAAGRANIYVTRTSFRGSLNRQQILLNGTAVGEIAWNTYLLLVVDPGTHEVTIVTPESRHSVTVRASNGENHFVSTVSRTGLVHARAELQVLTDSEGRQAVLATQRAATR